MSEDLYWRLHSLSRMLESSGRIDAMEYRDAYPTILDAMNAVRAAEASSDGSRADKLAKARAARLAELEGERDAYLREDSEQPAEPVALNLMAVYAQACNLADWANAHGTIIGNERALYEAAAKLRDMIGAATHAATPSPQPLTLSEEQIEIACDSVSKAFQLGQTYWQQADGESYKQNKKSYETLERYHALVDDTRAVLAAAQEKP